MKEMRKLGDFIQPVDVRNSDLSVTRLLGLSINKCFIESIANTIGTDFRPYKIVKKGQFAYGPVTSRNGEKITIALLEEPECIISSSYAVFEITDTSKLLPEYLMLWFSRPEFDRYARYKSHGSVREIFDWDEMCRVELPVPDIKEQQKIVDTYNAITKRIRIKQKINENLEKTAQAIFRKTFITYDDYDGDMPSTWKQVPLNDLCSVVTKGTTPTTLGFDFTSTGINFIKGESLTDTHFFDFDKMDHINEETNIALRRSIIFEDDILFSMAGTIGKFAMADRSIVPANTNQAICIIRCNKKKINPLYIYSFFIGDWHNEYYTRRIQEAVQANLSLENIKSLPIILLDEKEMKKYEELVYPLFNKIRNNALEIEKLNQFKKAIVTQISKR